MTLQSSGSIRLKDIRDEVGATGTTNLKTMGTKMQLSTSNLRLKDFYGLTYAATITPGTLVPTTNYTYQGYAAVDTLAPFSNIPSTTLGAISDIDIPSIPSETTNNFQVAACCFYTGPFSETPLLFLAVNDTVSGSPYPFTGWTTIYFKFGATVVSLARSAGNQGLQCSSIGLSGCDVRYQFNSVNAIYNEFTSGVAFDIYFK